MPRLISELPEGLRILAEQRRREDDHQQLTDDNLSSAFVWSRTPERHNFWADIRYNRPNNIPIPSLQEDDQIIK